MANNNNLFNAALAGAATGVASRSITNTDPAFYAGQAALINDFAVAFDAQIAPIVGGGSAGQASVVSDICAAFWRDRIITIDADLTAVAAALAALFAALDPDILPDPGGGAFTALGNCVWVDPTSTADGGLAVNGTSTGAYPTLAAAFGSGKRGYLLSPSNYVGEGVLNPQALGVADLTMIGMGGELTNGLFATGVQIAGLASIGGSFYFQNISAGDVTAQIIVGKTSAFNNFNPLAFSSVFDCDILGDGCVINVGSGSYIFQQSRFRTGGGQQILTVNGPVVGATGALIADEFTLASLGQSGLQLAGTAPVNPNPNQSAGGFWRLNNQFGQFVAHLRDAARTLNNVGGNTWNCSRAILPEGTLTANRVLTVNVTNVPVAGTFRIDRYDTSGNTYEVKDQTNAGTLVPARTRMIFNVQAGVLTPIQSELLGHP